ncbi:MAG: hypothetical protein U0324_46825 [Polyangiales bacterium]
MTGPSVDDTPSQPLHELTLGKLTRVLGEQRGRALYRDVLSEAGLREVRTPDDLYVFSEHLSKRGGFEAALGALLGVAAVMRGASARA